MASKTALWWKIPATLVVVLLILAFLATRSFFITGVILPKVSESAGMDIQAEAVRLSFGGVALEGISVEGLPDGGSFEAAAVSSTFAWPDLMNGRVHVDTVDVVDPVLVVPLTSEPSSSAESPSDSTEQNSPSLDVQQLTIQNGTIQLMHPEQIITLSSLNLDVSRVAPDSDGSVILTSQLLLEPTDPETSPQQGSASLEATYTLNASLLPRSLKGALQLDVESSGKDIPAFSIQMSPNLSFNPDTKLLQIESLNAQATQEGNEILSLLLKAPTQVDLSSSPPRVSDTSLALSVPGIATRILPFSSLFPVQADLLSLKSELVIAENGEQVTGTLTANANGLNGTVGPLPLSNASLSVNADAEGSMKELTLKSLSASLQEAGTSLLTISASGATSFNTGAAEITLQDLFVASTLAEKITPDPLPVQGTLRAKGRVARKEDGLTRFNLSSSFQTTEPSPLFPLGLNLVGEATETSALIRTARLQWPKSSSSDNLLKVRGSAEWSDPTAPQVELIAEGGSVNVTPWLSLAPEEEASTGETPSAPKETSGLEPLPIGPSSLTLDLSALQLEDVLANEVIIHVAAGPTSIVLHPVSFTLDDATLSTSTSLSWENQAVGFESFLKITALNLQPIFDTFLVQTPGAVKGILDLETTFAGTGVTPTDILSSLKGSINLGLTEGQIRLFAPMEGSPDGLLETQELLERIIRTLANALGVPPSQMLDPPIEQITFNASIAQETLQLEEFMAENSEFRLISSGILPFNPANVSRSDVGALPVSLGVSTNIAERIRIYREDRLVDGKIMLPPLMDITGTLAEPEIDVRKRVISGLVITGVTERNKTGNERVDAALGILGGLLSGEGPPPTPTPTPTQAPQ